MKLPSKFPLLLPEAIESLNELLLLKAITAAIEVKKDFQIILRESNMLSYVSNQEQSNFLSTDFLYSYLTS